MKEGNVFTCRYTFRFRTRPLAGTASVMTSDSVRGRVCVCVCVCVCCLYLFSCLYSLTVQARCPGNTPQLSGLCSFCYSLDVSEREEGIVVLHLLIRSLKPALWVGSGYRDANSVPGSPLVDEGRKCFI